MNRRTHNTLAGAALIGLAELLLPRVALAHGGPEGRQVNLLTDWTFEPLAVASIALAAVVYALGLRRIWSVAGRGHGIKRWEANCYLGGIAALVLALISPLHPLGSVLFSAHMTQHEVLMLIAAPLMVLGRPLAAMMAAIPRTTALRLAVAAKSPAWTRPWRLLSNAFTAWCLHAVILWAWHIPVLFQAVLESEFIHTLQHASFFLSAALFWYAAMHAGRAVAYGTAILYLFTTALHTGLLGAMITFAEHLWYPAYRGTTQAWGLTPLEDQQLGGLIMWVPAAMVYIMAALLLMVGWLRESSKRVERWQRAETVAQAPASHR